MSLCDVSGCGVRGCVVTSVSCEIGCCERVRSNSKSASFITRPLRVH